MKISKILDDIWFFILIFNVVLGFCFWFYVFFKGFSKYGISFISSSMFFGFLSITLLTFTYLIAAYIQRTKKDKEILEIMEDIHERTCGYREQLAFSEGMGPMGQMRTFLDHGGFFLFPFVQRRKNYRDIDVKKIPFKKKFPFILFFISTFSVPVFGLIAWAIN